MRWYSLPNLTTEIKTMGKYKLVVFDLDGTILHTSPGVLESVKDAINIMGLPMPDEKTLKRFVGPPIENSMRAQFCLDEEQTARAAATFRERYQNVNLYNAIPYDGIYEVFAQLVQKGITPAVATYKRHSYAHPLLVHFDFDRYTDVLFGSDADKLTTKSAIIEACMEKAGISDPAQVLMVGDTIHDATGAATLGIDFLGVTYGYGLNEEEIKNTCAIGYVSVAADILKYVE